jgi:hypothetical protein
VLWPAVKTILTSIQGSGSMTSSFISCLIHGKLRKLKLLTAKKTRCVSIRKIVLLTIIDNDNRCVAFPENHTKPKSTLWINMQLLNIKTCGMYTYHWTVKIKKLATQIQNCVSRYKSSCA